MNIAGKMDAGEPPARAKFSLHGPEEEFDPRVTAHRGDLADVALAGKMFAPHYAEPMAMRCTAPKAMIRAQGSKDHVAVTELLHGEDFQLLDVVGDWAWGYCAHDGYVGYLPIHALQNQQKTEQPTHLVSARGALIFREPEVKAGVIKRLPMGARLACGEETACGKFLAIGKGYVPRQHVTEIGGSGTAVTGDALASTAEQLIGAPYLWGGRSGDGLDCSGLIQMVLGLHGIEVPRDADQQLSAVGKDIDAKETLQRGDILFFPDHVGMMADPEQIIHANMHWMRVATEPLTDVIARFGPEVEEPVLARRRVT